jgi:hypothetical protein
LGELGAFAMENSLLPKEVAFFLKELKPLFEGSILFHREGAFLPEELLPFPKQNSLLFGEVVFSLEELFLLHGEFVWDQHVAFFPLKKLLPKSNQLKIYIQMSYGFFDPFHLLAKIIGKRTLDL